MVPLSIGSAMGTSENILLVQDASETCPGSA